MNEPPRLPPCLPHDVADCPICLAEAERIVDGWAASGTVTVRFADADEPEDAA